MTDSQLPDIDRETKWSRSLIQLLAEAIRQSHIEKPTSWALYYEDGVPRLNVGKRNVCVLDRDHFELFVNANRVEKMKLGHLNITIIDRDNKYPHLGTISFPKEQAAQVVETLRSSHLSAVGEVSWIQTPRGKMHDECLRLKLNKVGNVNIKSPIYTGYKTLKQLNCE